jgi:hypothetical protein
MAELPWQANDSAMAGQPNSRHSRAGEGGLHRLIGCRLLNVIDHEHVHRTVSRFQFESELLL